MAIKLGEQTIARYRDDEDWLALAGYCFGTVPLDWGSRRDPMTEAAPQETFRFRWAYATFDCARRPSDGLTVEEVCLAAAVDSQLLGKNVLAVQAILPEVNESLDAIPPTLTFTDLSPTELTRYPETRSSPAWGMWRACELLRGVRVPHKVLHHHRPSLFPMMDSETASAFARDKAWSGIQFDLAREQRRFQVLEDRFAELADQRCGVPLHRLRIHDVLLWGGLNDTRREEMVRLGESVVNGGGGWLRPAAAMAAT